MRIKRRGVEMRLVIEGVGDPRKAGNPDPALIKAIVRANKWFDAAQALIKHTDLPRSWDAQKTLLGFG